MKLLLIVFVFLLTVYICATHSQNEDTQSESQTQSQSEKQFQSNRPVFRDVASDVATLTAATKSTDPVIVKAALELQKIEKKDDATMKTDLAKIEDVKKKAISQAESVAAKSAEKVKAARASNRQNNVAKLKNLQRQQDAKKKK